MVIHKLKLLLAAALLWPSLAFAQIIYNGNSTFDANQPMAFGARSGQPAGFGVGGASSDANASLSFTAKGTGSVIFNSPLTSGTNGDASGLSVTIPNVGPTQLGTALANPWAVGVPLRVPILSSPPSTAPGVGFAYLFLTPGPNCSRQLEMMPETSTVPVIVATVVGSGC